MKNTKRGIAFRRHQYNRLKAKRIKQRYWGRGYEGFYDWCQSTLGIAVNTPKVCSCYMCGNPRKHWKQVSFKELKFKEVFLED